MSLNLTKNKQLQKFCLTFGLTNIDQGLLRQAFTHSSAAKKNNERLEFLGDAVLDCVISEALYEKIPHAHESYLTRLRSSLVNKEALAGIANKMQLSDYLILGQGENTSGGRYRDSTLADAFEALIGAIFKSLGYFDVKNFIISVYSDLLENLPSETALKDPKTRLQEWLQKRGQDIPLYSIVAESGKPHAKTFTVEAVVHYKIKNASLSELRLQAEGKSRRAAEQQVAEDILISLDEKLNERKANEQK